MLSPSPPKNQPETADADSAATSTALVVVADRRRSVVSSGSTSAAAPHHTIPSPPAAPRSVASSSNALSLSSSKRGVGGGGAAAAATVVAVAPPQPAGAATTNDEKRRERKRRRSVAKLIKGKPQAAQLAEKSGGGGSSASSSSEEEGDAADAEEKAQRALHSRMIQDKFSAALLLWRSDFATMVGDLVMRLAASAPPAPPVLLPKIARTTQSSSPSSSSSSSDAERLRSMRHNALALNADLFFTALQHRASKSLPLVAMSGGVSEVDFFRAACQPPGDDGNGSGSGAVNAVASATVAKSEALRAQAAGGIGLCGMESNPPVLATAGACYLFEERLCALFEPPYDALCRRAIQELQTHIYADSRKAAECVTLADMQLSAAAAAASAAFSSSSSSSPSTRIGGGGTVAHQIAANRYVRMTWTQLFAYLLDKARTARTMLTFKQSTLVGQMQLLERTVDRWRRATTVRLLREWYSFTMRRVTLRKRYREMFVAMSTTATVRRALSNWRAVCRAARDAYEQGLDSMDEVVNDKGERVLVPKKAGAVMGVVAAGQQGKGGAAVPRHPIVSADGMAHATVRALQGQLVVRGSMLDHLNGVVRALRSKAAVQVEVMEHTLQRQRQVYQHFTQLLQTLYPSQAHFRCLTTDDWEGLLKQELDDRNEQLQLAMMAASPKQQQANAATTTATTASGLGSGANLGLSRVDSLAFGPNLDAAAAPFGRLGSGLGVGAAGTGTNNNSRSMTPDPFAAAETVLEWHKVLATNPRTSTRASHMLVRVRHVLSVLCLMVSNLQRDLSAIVAPPPVLLPLGASGDAVAAAAAAGHDQQQLLDASATLTSAASNNNLNLALGGANNNRTVSFHQGGNKAAASHYTANVNDARAVLSAFMEELDVDTHESIIDNELSFIRALLSSINRVAFAGLYLAPSDFNEAGATIGDGALQRTMANVFLTPHNWARVIEFDDSRWMGMIKSCVHALFALCPLQVPKLVLTMDSVVANAAAAAAATSTSSPTAPNAGGVNAAHNVSFARRKSLGDLRSAASGGGGGAAAAASNAIMMSAHERNFKAFRKRAQQAQAQARNAVPRIVPKDLRGLPSAPMPAVSALRKEWQRAVDSCHESQWQLETCQRDFEERARQLVSDAYERGQSAQIVASTFDQLLRASPRLRHNIPVDVLMTKLRMVFEEDLQHMSDASGGGSSEGFGSARYNHSHHGGGGGGAAAASSSSSLAAPSSALLSTSSKFTSALAGSRNTGAWRSVLQGRKVIQDAQDLDLVLHSISKITQMDVAVMCERLVASLDDTDLFFVALCSNEIHTVLLEHAHELAHLFVLNATKRSAPLPSISSAPNQQQVNMAASMNGGKPPPPPQNNRHGSVSFGSQSIVASSAAAAMGSSSGGGGGSFSAPAPPLPPLMMSRDDFVDFCKQWCDPFLSVGALMDVFVRCVQRYSEDARSVTNAQQQGSLLMSQEVFPYAMVMVAACKNVNPFVPLKTKLTTFLSKQLVPLANATSGGAGLVG